jgi:hypothetical protein
VTLTASAHFPQAILVKANRNAPPDLPYARHWPNRLLKKSFGTDSLTVAAR